MNNYRCADRELNPGYELGKLMSYHWTIGACDSTPLRIRSPHLNIATHIPQWNTSTHQVVVVPPPTQPIQTRHLSTNPHASGSY
jgi:hypothetical protein